MKPRLLLISILGLLLIFTGTASSQITAGNIFEVLDGSNVRIGSTIDHWGFTVNSAGSVTFDMLSWEYDFTTTGQYVDVNGDGEIAFLDTYVMLFQDDGSLDTGDYLTTNDDSGSGFGDGTIYALDSYLSTNLAVGNYIFTVGAYWYDTNDAVSGINNSATYYPEGGMPIGTAGYDPNADIDHGDYQITWSGDVTITSDPGTAVDPVPEPGTMVLLGIGLIGLAGMGRRRYGKKS
jgi:PEP-CTERM motif